MLQFLPNRVCALGLLALAISSAWVASEASPADPTGSHPEAAVGSLVTKVEPPNWWLGLPNPMLLLTGTGLAGAQVSTKTHGVRVIRTMNGLSASHLLVWLEIAKGVSSGTIRLDLATARKHQEIDFPLEPRSPAGMTPAANSGFNGFSPDDVIYLIMPDRFDDGDSSNNFADSGSYDRHAPRAYHGGDLRGIQDRLPYLKDLGVTTIWITPIYQNDDSTGRDYHGYGAIDLYAVEKHLGALADYRSLVNAAHALGMKVVLDVVPNHVGPTIPWVDDPPTAHWLHGTRAEHLAAHSSFVALTDPHAAPREWRDVVEGWFANILPDMGTDDPITAQYLRQNALWWAETGKLDGFRLDTFPYVDRSFWHGFHADVHRAYPRFRTVGEVFNPDPTVTSYFVGGKTNLGIDTGLDTVFDFPLYFAIREITVNHKSATLLEDVLRHDWMFPHPENLVTFLGNHDTRRFMGETGATIQELKLAFSLLLTVRGIPQIYYGDEIAMTGGEDPDNRRDFPGGFPEDQHNAFTDEGRGSIEQESFAFVRDLLHLRQQHSALRTGTLHHIFSDDQTYAYSREFNKSGAPDRLLMVMNNSADLRTIVLNVADTSLADARTVVLLKGSGASGLVKDSQITVSVSPQSLNIYRID